MSLKNVRSLAHKAWSSPTIMSYGAFFARTLGQIILLPFILTIFSTEEIFLWYLFATIIGLQLLVDMGFGQTFSRVISFAMGGAGLSELLKPSGNASGKPSLTTIQSIVSTMIFIYKRLSLIWFLCMLIIGTLIVWQTVSTVQNDNSIWIAWAAIVLISPISMFGAVYNSYLLGVNKVAVVRRWEVITSTLSTISCLITIIYTKDLVLTLLVSQLWRALVVIRNRHLAIWASNNHFQWTGKSSSNPKVMKAVWPSVWRTGVGTTAGWGVIQASALIFAQIATPGEATSYFLAIKFMQLVSQFSQAPFYSKLPVFARLYSEGRQEEMTKLAKRSMALSYMTFLAGFVFLGSFGEAALVFIGSNAKFPSIQLWSLLGVGFYAERYGAMHINLFSSCNTIIHHIANGVAGILYIVSGIALYPIIGIYSFPVSIIIGNVGFYSWFAASHSYRAFSLNWWTYEKSAMLPGLIVLLVYIFVLLIARG